MIVRCVKISETARGARPIAARIAGFCRAPERCQPWPSAALYPEQPLSFAFTPENVAWAKREIAKYPPGKEASAVLPLLWRAQEQEGWTTEPAIRAVADMLGMAYIRVLEIATFYTMFLLAPVGKTAHLQVCGTTPCMLRGSEALIEICKERIAEHPHELSRDGQFSWEEVECLGCCANAPMVQIGKDTYEDLTPELFEKLLLTAVRDRAKPARSRASQTGPAARSVLRAERADDAARAAKARPRHGKGLRRRDAARGQGPHLPQPLRLP